MSRLLDYVNNLDRSAAARFAHQADPVSCMSAFGLSSGEREALLSGDSKPIADAMGIPFDTLKSMHTPNTYNTCFS